MIEVAANFQMIATFALIVIALGFFAAERTPMELTSLGVVVALLLFFHFFPVPNDGGMNLLGPTALLKGFANPALITVLALLVIGQGLVRTGVLDQAAQLVFRIGGGGWRAMCLILLAVISVSAFLNNIPVVVIFIPILQALAERSGKPASGLMMPLSFAAILGGMTTLIGSSTNLLVSSELVVVGEAALGFFSFTVPGMVMASVGFVYVLVVAPHLLPHREAQDTAAVEGRGRQFITQLTVPEGSTLVGANAVAGMFRPLADVTVRVVRRGRETLLPPFENVAIEPGDVLVVAATRKQLTGILGREARLFESGRPDRRRAGDQILAEVMVTPASLLVGQTVDQARFDESHHCNVLGVQRRSRMLRSLPTQISLEAGDVLLIQGHADDVRALRFDSDVLLMEWSATDLPARHLTGRAALVFLLVVVAAAGGFVPIVVAAVTGAALMVIVGALNVTQAVAALDQKVVMLIGTALALGVALQETGGAHYLAQGTLAALGDASPATILSVFFLLVAVLSNVISTKTCAVLFTPIAVSIARELGVDPMPFAVAVVFAANCSFASPIGYQTNLLVMTPGQYRFTDFVRAGAPLIVIMWVTFSLFAPWYYSLL